MPADSTRVMSTQNTRSEVRLNQSIDWIRVGITRMVHGNGIPQYNTSTPRSTMGVWMNPEISVMATPVNNDARLSRINFLKFLSTPIVLNVQIGDVHGCCDLLWARIYWG